MEKKEFRKYVFEKAMLPKGIDEFWKANGILFEDVNSAEYILTLPRSYRIEKTIYSDHFIYEVYDGDGKKVATWYSFEPQPVTRYRIMMRHHPEKNALVVYFGNEEELLYVAGEQEIPTGNVPLEKERAYIQKNDSLKAQAEKWADENYPKWRDPKAYWDKTYEKEIYNGYDLHQGSMYPNDMGIWLKLGFTFKEKGNGLYFVTLPNGWYLEKVIKGGKDKKDVIRIFDDKNRLRARSYGRLLSKYDVIWSFKGKMMEISFGSDEEVLFTAGGFNTEGSNVTFFQNMCRLERDAMHWGDEHYPDWRNPVAYWNDVKEISDGQKKI